jgi:predicted nucleotidyltransferase
MRLKNDKLSLLQSFNKKIKWDFYLFWSRLDDSKKWGDIDLLIINKSKISNLKLSLLLEKDFFKEFEEKIDIVVFNENMKKEEKIFFNNIKKEKIC